MSLLDYKNSKAIIDTHGKHRGKRISENDSRLLEGSEFEIPFSQNKPASHDNPYQVEFHVYTINGGLISSDHEVQTWNHIRRPSERIGNRVLLDIHNDIKNLGFYTGNYKVVYNFLRNHVGSYTNTERLFVSEISPSRRELKLKLTNPESAQSQGQLKTFIEHSVGDRKFANSYVLNFGDNKLIRIVGVGTSGQANVFFVKLYDPLPKSIDVNTSCWISTEIVQPYIDSVLLIPKSISKPINTLRGPNTSIDYDYWITTETDFKNWNDILGSSTTTTQELLDKYFSGSIQNVDINIDYSDFSNFVHFSSAKERFDNFVYKVQLIEFYDTQLNTLDSLSGSLGTNRVSVQNNRNKIVSGFDGFEKWMYYGISGSYLYSYPGSSSLTPYPKIEVSGSATGSADFARGNSYYSLLNSTSSQAITWYHGNLSSASNYDVTNQHSLQKSIPEFIQLDASNDQYVLFVNMLGQHFDIMYSYIHALTSLREKEEHPNDGIPNNMLYHVAKNMGWTLSHGTQKNDLWKYALGLTESGDPLFTGDGIVDETVSDYQRTTEVWRRITNNLPYILKTKGTERSVKALLACYGIPSTLLSIREYGGGNSLVNSSIPTIKTDKYTYFLNMTGSVVGTSITDKGQYVSVPWKAVRQSSLHPSAIELRFKPENGNLYGYENTTAQTLLQLNTIPNATHVVLKAYGQKTESGSVYVYMHNSSSYQTMSITSPYLLDGNPLTLLLQRSQDDDSVSLSQTYTLYVGKSKYDKIHFVHSASLSFSGSSNHHWVTDGTLLVGSGSNAQTTNAFSGSLFELRYWSTAVTESAFRNHVLSARSYNGNSPTSSYDHLALQTKFWDKFDVAVTQSVSSSHPNQNYRTFTDNTVLSASLMGFTSNSFEGFVETYVMETPSVGGKTTRAEKIRIEDDTILLGELSPVKRVEYSSFDKNSLDSDKLMIAFSPQHIINEDISEHIGHISLDDFIGDPNDVYGEGYKHLEWLAREYWKKYDNKNDFGAYLRLLSIFDFSLFHQIRQLLPLRANAILGLVVEPNILERSKVKTANRPTIFAPSTNNFDTQILSASILPHGIRTKIEGATSASKPVAQSEKSDYEADIDDTMSVGAEKSNYEADLSSMPDLVTSYNTYTSLLRSAIIYTLNSEYTVHSSKINGVNFQSSSDSYWSNIVYTASNIDYGYGLNWVTQSNAYWKRNAVTRLVSASYADGSLFVRKHFFSSSQDIVDDTPYSSSLVVFGGISPYKQPLGVQRARYYGCAMVGSGVNIDSDDTVDGNPVVEVQKATGTQLRISDFGVSGSLTTI